MKITSMEQLGKCMDDGVEVEAEFSGGWGGLSDLSREQVCLFDMPGVIEKGKLRTKPKPPETVKFIIERNQETQKVVYIFLDPENEKREHKLVVGHGHGYVLSYHEIIVLED